jgi:hypothetical protein
VKKIKEQFHLKEIEPGIILITFDDDEDMSYTMMRFQEHYENPKFRSTIFSFEAFEKWYKKFMHSKKYTYHKDWNGFNFPSYVLRPFYDGKFKKITKREKYLLDMLKDIEGDFYVIGCKTRATRKNGTMDHEIVHARFHLNKKYREEVLRAISKHDVKEIYQVLCQNMYDYSTWNDEINSYLVTGLGFLEKKIKNMSILEKLRKELIEINKKYFN